MQGEISTSFIRRHAPIVAGLQHFRACRNRHEKKPKNLVQIQCDMLHCHLRMAVLIETKEPVRRDARDDEGEWAEWQMGRPDERK
jgi:hypothetical protein